MADSTPAAAVAAAHLPSPADIARAERFTRERFVHEGEGPSVALGVGTPRRHALDAALAEIAQGLDHPSTQWRRAFSLLLGLERLLSEDEPHLADGTLLNPHQVDALSGTLTALLAGAMSGDVSAAVEANGNGHSNGVAALAAVPPLPDEPFAGSSAVPGEEEIDEELPDDEEPQDWDEPPAGAEEEQLAEQPEDPNAHKRFWFEHATGAGKTVAALGFVEASRTGGVLILTHRRNLVDQFIGELRDRGYRDRIHAPLMRGDRDPANGPVTVETYQWFVRNAGRISSAYTVVICDEAHTALGEKTSEAIRVWTGPIFVGMTATGALIARHVTDLFPTQTSRFDLAQAARRGVIAPLRGIRIPPGAGVRSIAKVPLRRGEVDVEFDQELLAELLDQIPFNLAIANLYKTRFNGVPGVVYAAGVRHAYNVAEAFRDEGLKAMAVSGETPKRELADILARYERGDIDVLVNAQLLAEGWNSPRATVCMHLAPTASKRIYQQRVGRVTRRNPGKESGVVVDFVHPATKHDDPVVTLHSLLDRDVYRGGAIVVGPVRRGRGRRVRVERRVLPVTADPERRAQVFERELWRIAVEHLDWGEQHVWAALAGARVQPSGWRRARAMLHFDRSGELKRRFLLTAVQRNKSSQLRIRALQEIAAAKDAEAFDLALDEIGAWSRDERREAVKVGLQALAEKKIGRRDQANAWIWRMAEYTREVHEEYAVQRWPETKRLLGLLVNSSGGAHARNARRLVHATRKQDRRLSAALLAAALAHTPEAEEVLRGARTRMARKPNSLARDLLRNFPKKRSGRGSRRKRRAGEDGVVEPIEALETTLVEGTDDALDDDALELDTDAREDEGEAQAADEADATAPAELAGRAAGPEPAGPPLDEQAAAEQIAAAAALLPTGGRRGGRSRARKAGTPPTPALIDTDGEGLDDAQPAELAPAPAPDHEAPKKPARRTRAKTGPTAEAATSEAVPADPALRAAEPALKPARRTRAKAAAATSDPSTPQEALSADAATTAEPAPKPARRSRARAAAAADAPPDAAVEAEVKPARRSRAKAAAADPAPEAAGEAEVKPARRSRKRAAEAADSAATDAGAADEAPKPARRARAKVVAADAPAEAEAPAKPVRRSPAKVAVEEGAEQEAEAKPARRSRAKAASVEGGAEAEAKPVRRARAKAASESQPGEAAADAKPARRSRAKAASEPVGE